MNRHHLLLAIAAEADALTPGQAPLPQAPLFVTGLLLGLIAAIAAGLLHRKDGASVPAAVVRAGSAFVGGTALSVVSLLTTKPLVTITLLLSSAVVSLVAGVLTRMDGQSLPASIWRAAIAFAGIAGLGQLIVGLYADPLAVTALATFPSALLL